jgi:hypothetical protein
VPLAPGYKIERQSITVRFVTGSPPHLAVRAEYRLANIGNSNLDSVEIGLPGRKNFERENLHVQINGKDVVPEIARGVDADEGESASSESWPVVWRIPFSPSWHRKQKRNLLIAYDLTAAAEPRGRMYITPSMFLLNDSGWFPDPIAPKSLFAKDLVRPDPSELNIIVPKGFLALGSGEPHGERRSNAETEYRFRLRKDDFDPFVISGQYHEQRVRTADGTVDFWPLQSSPTNELQKVGTQILAARKLYETVFGSLPKSVKTVTVVVIPLGTEAIAAPSATGIATLPALPGIVLRPLFTEQFGGVGPPIPSDPSLDLAGTWFEKLITPEDDAWLLSDALSAYAFSSTSSDSTKRPDRAKAIRDSIGEFDALTSIATEEPISIVTRRGPTPQIRISDVKAQIMMYALEDKCGNDNLNHALAHMISALRFQQYGYDDFRSAVEEECHQDLGPFFRSWLNEKGIPADFRAKYEAVPEKKN